MAQYRVAVLGGGFSAVAAARQAALEGHRVTLIHPLASLGGDITASHHAWMQNGATGEPLPLPVGATKKDLYARLGEEGVNIALLSHAAGFALAEDKVCGVLLAHPFGLSYLEVDAVIDATTQGIAAIHMHGEADSEGTIAEYTFDAENVESLPVRTLALPTSFGVADNAVYLHDTLREKTVGVTFRFATPTAGDAFFRRTAIEREAHTRALQIAEYLRAYVPYFEEMLVAQLATQTRLLRTPDARPLPANVRYLPDQMPADFSNRDLKRCECDAAIETTGFLNRLSTPDAVARRFLSHGKQLNGVNVGADTSIDMPAGFHPCTLDAKAQPFAVLRAKAIVAGAGTGGAMAAWALLDAGIDTIVLEQSHFCGGTNTVGLVGGNWHGYTGGLWNLRIQRVKAMLERLPVNPRIGAMALWEDLFAAPPIRFAGGVTVCGVIRDGKQVQGALAYGEGGFALALGDVVIDGTAEAALCAFAGAGFDVGGERDGFVQSTSMWGIDPRRFTNFHNNHYAMDFDVVRPGDYRDLLRAIGLAHRFNSDYLFSDLYTVRESRRIHGGYALNMHDIALRTCFDDTIAVALCTHDTHGRPNSMLNTVSLFSRDMSETREMDIRIRLPLRAFLPTELDGLAIVGKGFSGEREAVSLCRMNPDISNTGYAVGLCAAHALQQGVSLREVNLRKAQTTLRDLGVLPPWADQPTHQLDMEMASHALDETINGGFPAMMQEKEAILPLLRHALSEGGTRAQNAAMALAWFGEKEAAPTLASLLKAVFPHDIRAFEPVGKGDLCAVTYAGVSKNVTQESKYGHISLHMDDPDIAYPRINQWIAMLGLAGDVETGLAAILPYADRAHSGGPIQRGKTAYSHARVDTHEVPMHERIWCLCYALERLADPRAVPALSRLLAEVRQSVCTTSFAPVPELQSTYLEIGLARALARCGGREGALRLAAYVADVRAVFAKMAHDELVLLYQVDHGRDAQAWTNYLSSLASLPIIPYRGSPYAG